jgi:hypothetical protein
MAEKWPANLDDCFIIAGYTEQKQPVAIRSEVEAGQPKVRRRFTRGVKFVSAAIKADRDQLNDFYSFFDVDLKGGVLRFEFQSPTSGTVREFRFLDPPVVTPLTDKYFQVAMNLEQMN